MSKQSIHQLLNRRMQQDEHSAYLLEIISQIRADQQFWGLPLSMGQLGSGDGNQPFKTVKDYDNWLGRATKFAAWTDSAVVYFKRGIDVRYVLPKVLVVKMIPEMDAMVVKNDTASLFFTPIKKLPANFSAADKSRLTAAYIHLIHDQLIPSYKKLSDFLKTTYLPKARETAGINALPDGKDYYQYLIRSQTTTNKTPEEIYNTGLSEVARITTLQDSVKNAVGFKGDMNAFFEYMKTDALCLISNLVKYSLHLKPYISA